MMKPGSISADKSENSDVIRRLYRGVTEMVKALEKMACNASCLEDAYRLNVINLRTRLRETLERLMFLDPVGYGKKSEDLLWRKVYYDFVSIAKNFRKNGVWSEGDHYRLSNHISVGIGTYHHLLFRLQSEFGISVEGCADFLFVQNRRCSVKDISMRRKVITDDLVSEWAIQAFQRCLTCMGDLARYCQEFGSKSVLDFAATRYYHQALLVPNHSSMPHNQLGTLAGVKNYEFDAAYHYMRCVMCKNGFEGAHGNLNRIFERNQNLLVKLTTDANGTDKFENCDREYLMKRFVIDFLHYCQVCFKYPDIDSNFPVENCCEVVHQEFQKCLEQSLSSLPSSNLNGESDTLFYLSNDVVFKFFVMNLMCIEKLEKESGEMYVSAATALTLTALSHIICHVIAMLREKTFGIEIQQNVEVAYVKPDLSPVQPLENNTAIGDKTSIVQISDANSTKADKWSKKSISRCRRKLRGSFSLDDSDDMSEHSISSESDLVDGRGCHESDVSEGDEDETESNTSSVDNDGDNQTVENGISSSHCSTNKIDADALNKTGDVIATDGDVVNSEGESDIRKTIETNIEVVPLLKPECTSEVKVDEDTKTEEELSINSFDFNSLSPLLVEEVLLQSVFLPVIKVCVDWLRSHPNLIIATAQGSQTFCLRYVELLNLLSKLDKVLKKDVSTCLLDTVLSTASSREFKQVYPLPEDVALMDFALLSNAHAGIDFNLRTATWLTARETIRLRLAVIRHLGHLLVWCKDSDVLYVSELDCFSVRSIETAGGGGGGVSRTRGRIGRQRNGKSNSKKEGVTRNREKHLMQNMAQLWLEAEVKELESSLNSFKKPMFSPYLIPDCMVLTDHLPLIRQLMNSKLFIFILPITVLQCLDNKKKESSKAREAIRWLEGEFQKRNRWAYHVVLPRLHFYRLEKQFMKITCPNKYLRSQKRHERLVLSVLKYPRRKDKEAWNKFALLECGNYFARQGTATREISSNLVTILTCVSSMADGGSNLSNLATLARTVGLKLENVDDLYSRWSSIAKNKSEKP